MAGGEEEVLHLMVTPDSVARLAAGCTAATCRALPRAAAEETDVNGRSAQQSAQQPLSIVHSRAASTSLSAVGIAIGAERRGEMSIVPAMVYPIFPCAGDGPCSCLVGRRTVTERERHEAPRAAEQGLPGLGRSVLPTLGGAEWSGYLSIVKWPSRRKGERSACWLGLLVGECWDCRAARTSAARWSCG
jgi:hypothetical protein